MIHTHLVPSTFTAAVAVAVVLGVCVLVVLPVHGGDLDSEAKTAGEGVTDTEGVAAPVLEADSDVAEDLLVVTVTDDDVGGRVADVDSEVEATLVLEMERDAAEDLLVVTVTEEDGVGGRVTDRETEVDLAPVRETDRDAADDLLIVTVKDGEGVGVGAAVRDANSNGVAVPDAEGVGVAVPDGLLVELMVANALLVALVETEPDVVPDVVPDCVPDLVAVAESLPVDDGVCPVHAPYASWHPMPQWESVTPHHPYWLQHRCWEQMRLKPVVPHSVAAGGAGVSLALGGGGGVGVGVKLALHSMLALSEPARHSP